MITKKVIDPKKNKQTIVNNWGFIPILLLLLIPSVYSFKKGFDKTYWDSAMSSWLATLLGIIIGIPIALWINRRIQVKEDIKTKQEAIRKNIEILKLIMQELMFDLNGFKIRQSKPETLQIHPYQVDVWEAFSASGEIKWISNINLLNRIASAYSIIKIEKSIENNWYLATRGAFAFSGTERAVNLILKDARSFDKLLEESINAAISEIETELKKF